MKATNRLEKKIDNVEQSLRKRIDEVEQSLGKRIDNVEQSFEKKINAVEKSLEQKISSYKIETIKWMIGLLFAQTALIVTLLKYMH